MPAPSHTMEKIYKIYWRDPNSISEWSDITEARQWAEKTYAELAESVGRVIIENDDYIVLAGSRLGEDYGELLLIMKPLIVKRIWLNDLNFTDQSNP